MAASPPLTRFATLLQFHMEAGTRPANAPAIKSQRSPDAHLQIAKWTLPDLADALIVSEGTVSNYRRGKTLPPSIFNMLKVFFADDARHARAREELLAAFYEARGIKASLLSPAISNIAIRVPAHFMGRNEALETIDMALNRNQTRVAITALHGLRGVGKTVLAAAYADRHCSDYRWTWWIHARTEVTIQADLMALGRCLDWIRVEEKEEAGLAIVMERLRHAEGILLIFDGAIDARHLVPYLPQGGPAHVLITSNNHAWRSVAEPVEISVWPKEVGADFLVARTGRSTERSAAELLSEALGGLPVAHEIAGAYCERLEVSLAEYGRLFAAKPALLLDDHRHAPGGVTVAKTFSLAIEEAAKMHPAAKPLMLHAALLAPEPIPLFLFREGYAALGEPLASLLVDDGLDEAVAALRAFALVNREAVRDERESEMETDTIRLHTLVREVSAASHPLDTSENARRALVASLVRIYPDENDPQTWLRMRRLDAFAIGLVGTRESIPKGVEELASELLYRLAEYRRWALGAYEPARTMLELSLNIREQAFGIDHSNLTPILDSFASLLGDQGDLSGAETTFKRALAISEQNPDPNHPPTGAILNNLGLVLKEKGDLGGAEQLLNRALSIAEHVRGPNHPDTAMGLLNVGLVRLARGDFNGARPLLERALSTAEVAFGPAHPHTAIVINSLARLHQDQQDHTRAKSLFERALAIYERTLDPSHPTVAMGLNNLAGALRDQGDLAEAQKLFKRALAICEQTLGPSHHNTATCLGGLAGVIWKQGDLASAQPLFERALVISENALGIQHPQTDWTVKSLAALLAARGNLDGAQHVLERASSARKDAHDDTSGSDKDGKSRSLC
jgi:tetratricopeptide (TPR) repeat protein